MSDDSDKKDNGEAGKTLSLKRTVDGGQVRQNFAHGRSKAVVVEKRRKRTIKQGELVEEAPAPTPAAAPENFETLSKREQNKRLAAVEEAKARAQKEEIEKAEAEAKAAAEKEEAERVKEIEEAKDAAKAAKQKTKKTKSGEEADIDADIIEAAAVAPEVASEADGRARRSSAGGDSKRDKKSERKSAPERTTERPTERRRRAGKLTISDALNDEERVRSLASIKRRREREKRQAEVVAPTRQARTIQLPDSITIQELANRMAERAADVIKILMQQGMMLKINDVIDADTAQIVAEDLGHKVKRVSESDIEEGLIVDDDDDALKTPRPPVVTIMGHVDHGKTSLLDALRQTKIADGEAGGITQHIGAYQVETKSGATISFIDTPGHAAFSAMRARGAKITDIVVLVVAGDDGVQPQSIEAIAHAKEAGAPIIVAINKMDKEGADATRVKNELLQHEVIVEGMGGETQAIEISAKSGAGLDDLLEAIALQAELMDLKANASGAAAGAVIEARLDKGRGPVATILVQRGSLNKGDIFVVGAESGKVRALIDASGAEVASATPSMPVEVLGVSGAPRAGEILAVVESEARAREIAAWRTSNARTKSLSAAAAQSLSARGDAGASLEQLLAQDSSGAKQNTLPLIVKADVQGSVEAIVGAVEKLGNDEVSARVVFGGVGGINESDISLAISSAGADASKGAIICGFNVRARAEATRAAEAAGLEIRYYNVIYDLVDDIQSAMSGMLAPDMRETLLGKADVKNIFSIKGGSAAGCEIADGKVARGAKVRIIRDDIVVHEGELSSLRRFKDEVKEVASGQECGMAFANFADVRAGDVIECFEVEAVSRTL